MTKRSLYLAFRTLLILFLTGPTGSFGQEAADQTQEAKQAPEGQANVRFESRGRRDPFINPLLLRRPEDDQDLEVDRGLPPPGIAGMYVSQIVLLGTSQNDDIYTAVFQGTDKRAYFLREGDRVFDGYLKRIQGDEVVMVRETQYRSGKMVTEEVTKRLRLP